MIKNFKMFNENLNNDLVEKINEEDYIVAKNKAFILPILSAAIREVNRLFDCFLEIKGKVNSGFTTNGTEIELFVDDDNWLFISIFLKKPKEYWDDDQPEVFTYSQEEYNYKEEYHKLDIGMGLESIELYYDIIDEIKDDM